MEPVQKCEATLIHEPSQEKIHRKKCLTGNDEKNSRSTRSTQSFENGCNIETGVYIAAGNTVKEMKTNGQDECSSSCASTDDCIAWTFRTSDNFCWLKSDDSSKGSAEGWITGSKECGTADEIMFEGDMVLDMEQPL